MGEPELKRAKLNHGANEEDNNGAEVDLDRAAGNVFEQIDQVQNEIDSLIEKACEEIVKVEQKYYRMRKPFYEKRCELLKKLSNFWATAIFNHPTISRIVDEDEECILQYLLSVEVEEFEDIKSGYRINFRFDENPFFENDCIIKEFSLANAQPTSTTTEIRWKDGQNMIDKIVAKRARIGDSSGPHSFFSWLTENGDASDDEIAEMIKDDLWPNPVQYYLLPDISEDTNQDRDDEEDDEEVSSSDNDHDFDDLEEADEVGEDD